MVPALFGVSVSQINLLLDTIFASLLTAGSVSWLYYSDRLMELPLGVFGVATATVILPHLSRQANNGSNRTFSLILDWAIRIVLLIATPATVILSLLSVPLLASLFNYGSFSGNSVLMTSKSLIMFSLGVIPLMLIKVLAAGFYARQNIATPVKVGIIAMLSNMVLNCLLSRPLAHAGIALATSVAAIINMCGLWYFLCQQQIYTSTGKWPAFISKIVLANVIMAVYLYWSKASNDLWLAHHASWRLIHLAALIVPAILIYFTSLWLTGIRYRDILSPIIN
jgi:putative peptidoglycan lipid II flippase